MNDSQNTAGGTNSQYGTTQNPQTTPAAQSISDTAGNLQTVSTPNLFSGDTSKVSITQVGDGNFVPFTPSNTTTNATTVTPPKPVNHHYPIIIGGGVLIVIIVVVTWLMSRNQKAY